MDHLQTEGRNPASANLDERTPLEIVRLMNAEDAKVIPAVASQAEVIAKAVEVIADRLARGGRLVYAGAGTSGRLGVLDATECPPTFNAPPGQVVGVIAGGPPALTSAVEGAEDHPEFAERDLEAIGLSADDVLVGIATSGRTPYVLGALAYARKQGAFTVGLSCNPDSDLIAHADLAITPVVGPEVLSGSTRLKAGTATKLVLNTLTTGAMVRLGKCYGNLMVDLRATNDKLRARTNRIVRQVTGLSAEEAGALLTDCGGELKTALVAARCRVAPDEARRLLRTSGGRVRPVVEAVAPGAPPRRDGLVLGIDGGGTSTVALLAARDPAAPGGWSPLGRGEAGPSNVQAVGTGPATEALGAAVASAFAAAGLPRQPVDAACFGLAGAGRTGDQGLIRSWGEQHRVADFLEVTTDAALLLAAGTPDGWGLAVVAGTGSIAYGRTSDGREARAGGWGYLFGDEGSGYRIGLAALEAVARAADGRGPATALTDRLLTRFGVGRPHDLIPVVYRGGWDRAALAGLAPLVFESAAGGDGVAEDVVTRAAQELAFTASASARQLGFSVGPVPLALAGGVLLSGEDYRRRFLDALGALGLQGNPVTAVREPAEGAIRLALSADSER